MDFQKSKQTFKQRAVDQGLVDLVVESHETPLGTLTVAASSKGLVSVFLPNTSLEQAIQKLEATSLRILAASNDVSTKARLQLDQYFNQTLCEFDLAIDWQLSKGFRLETLKQAKSIPYGTVLSYGELASKTQSPKAVRAVGSAMATNPLPIVVPCHRVVRSDGKLGNYFGGVQMKADLLQLENVDPDSWRI